MKWNVFDAQVKQKLLRLINPDQHYHDGMS
jgi:hypothetical protein